MVQNRYLFILLMLAAMTLPPTLARQAISAVTVAQAPDAAAPPAEPAEGIDPFNASTEPAPTEPASAVTAPLPPTFTLPESLPADTTLTIDGSVSMAAINRTLIRRFEERFPGVTVVVQEQGTAAALQGLVAEGGPDLAAIGRPLDEAEHAQGFVEIPLSREKIAIIVGDENPFQGDLTFDQFAQIFRGEITNWLYVGGPDLPIRFVDRPVDSDTRRALSGYDIFKAVEFSTGDNALTLEADDTVAVVEALGNDGISYAIASQVLDQDNVRVLTMDGTLPDDSRYPYSQPRGYAYTGTPSPAAAAFLAFATGAEGQAALAEAKSAEAADVATAELPTSVTAMRPNGQGFVTGDREGNIKFWNIDGSSAGAPEEAAHTGPVTALAFSPDGNRIISGGADGTVRFWDAVGNPVGEPIAAHGDPVSTLAVFPDGTFASASTDGSLRRWDTSGSPVGEPIAAHGDTVRAATVSPDGQTLVTAGNDGQVKLWNPAGTANGAFGGHDGPVTAVAVKPDNTLVTGGEDSTVRLWDGAGTPIGNQPAAGPVTALAVSDDGETLATGDNTGTVQMRNSDGTPAGEPVSDIGTPIDSLAFTPDGERLVVSAQDQPPQLRNQAGELVTTAAPEADSASETDGPFASLLERLKALGPRLWILGFIAILGLLLWQLLQGLREDEEDEEEDAIEPSGDVAIPAGDSLGRFEDVPAAAGEDIDWSAASGDDVDFGQADFGQEDSGQADFGQADFGQADFGQADTDFVAEPVVSGGVPNAIAAVPPAEAAQGLDTRLSKAKTALGRGLELAQGGQLQAALDATNQAIESADVERLKALGAGVSLAGVGAIIARGMMRRGGILTALKRPEDALSSYDRALQLGPNDPDAWVGKGNLLLSLGRSDEALFCFDKAIELKADSGAAWRGKAQALQQMNRMDEAQSALNRAESLGPDQGEPTFAPLQGGTGAAVVGGAADTSTGLRPDPVPADAGEDIDADIPAEADMPAEADIPPDLQAALGHLPDFADTPDSDSPDAPPIDVPEEVDSLWVETDDESFDDEDATIIQAGSGIPSVPDQGLGDDDTIAFSLDDEDAFSLDDDDEDAFSLDDNETLGFSAQVNEGSEESDRDTVGFSLELEDEVESLAPDSSTDFSLEQSDLDSLDTAFDLEEGLVDFATKPTEDDDFNADDLIVGTAEDDDLNLDLGNDGFEISLSPDNDEGSAINLASEPIDFALEGGDGTFSEADLALEGIDPKTFAEDTADLFADAVSPPPPPPRRPAPPPLPNNPKLEG
ncbi:MAG: substrate-binding domain-containing protein [Leptolyngbyaceae cyanobacterium]